MTTNALLHCLLLATTSLGSAAGSAADDLITNLPGADGLDLPNMYSGYLDLPDSQKHVFYWLVESTAADPATAPVALWTNGGPGCSGFIGLMTEQGPFRPTASGALELNPAAWQSEANMLFVEQPVGVGFSYSDNVDDYSTGDAQAAADLYHTAVAFFAKFDQYQGNDFYLTSESYGGHYLPSTAAYILAQPGAAAALNFKGFFLGNPWTDPVSNAVGRVQTLYGHGAIPKPDYDAWTSACLSTTTSTSTSSKSSKNGNNIMNNNKKKKKDNDGQGEGGDATATADCAAASAKVLHESKWDGQNQYALSYPACHPQPTAAQPTSPASSKAGIKASVGVGVGLSGGVGSSGPSTVGWREAVPAAAGAVAQRRWLWAQGGLGYAFNDDNEGEEDEETSASSAESASSASATDSPVVGASDLVYDPCVDNYGVLYLNRLDVQTALHVNASAAQHSTDNNGTAPELPIPWDECSYTLRYNKSDGLVPMMPTYLALLNDSYPLKLEVYSGDDDDNCPTLGTMQWAYGLGLEPLAKWNPWYYDDALYGTQFAGFQVSWLGTNGETGAATTNDKNGNTTANVSTLTLSTVHGAGHEVPTYKGQQALQLFRRFLAR